MGNPSPRSVRLVLVTSAGDVLGALPPFPVDTPWWQDMVPVIRGARERFRLEVVVLRLLEASRPKPPGGMVTYLTQVDDIPPDLVLRPWSTVLGPHQLRQPWAEIGGPKSDLAWADAVLRDRGIEEVGPAEQIRTWNLSSLWRIRVPDGTVWLKHVPAFFSHEGVILRRLAGGPVPSLLGHDGGRILMPEIPGEDLYDAPAGVLRELVRILVKLQTGWVGRSDELMALGLPDWRLGALAPAIDDVVARTWDDLEPDDRETLSGFVATFPSRDESIRAAGLPDTLVHGDFHSGNARSNVSGGGTDPRLVLLDWGDCGVGHPLLDQAAYLDRIRAEEVPGVVDVWRRAWRRAIPGSDPSRAAALLAPVAAARQAVIYRRFLDGIEPSEHPYHRADPADWLRRTAAILRG